MASAMSCTLVVLLRKVAGMGLFRLAPRENWADEYCEVAAWLIGGRAVCSCAVVRVCLDQY